MAKILSNSGILTGQPVEAHHVSQSVNALTAAEAYDISISGSLTVNSILYPITDGTAGQALITDGAGNATFGNVTAATASYITSSRVDGPYGFDSIQSASWSNFAETASFATDASSSLYALSANTAQTATSASYALTASYVEGVASKKFTFTNQTVIPVVHGLGSESVVVQVYEEVGGADPVMLIPDDITINSPDQLTVTLAVNTTGYVVISGGGFLRSGSVDSAQSASYAARVQHNLTNGTGISAFTYNGSTPQVVAFDTTYVVPSASFALTAAFAENVPENVETASYVSSSNVDGPFGMDSIQTASYALTASYIDLVETRRFNYNNVTTLTVTHNLDSENVFIQVYENGVAPFFFPRKIVPASIEILNDNQARITFAGPTSGFILAGQSGFIRGGNIDSASYALTASYALNAEGVSINTGSFVITSSITDYTQSFTKGDGSTYENYIPTASLTASYALTASYVDQIFTERFDFTNQLTVDFAHTLNTEDVFVQVYEVDGADYRQLIPNDIFIINPNLARVNFAVATTGYGVVTRGGIVQAGNVQNAVTASYVNNTFRGPINATANNLFPVTHNLGEEFPLVQAYNAASREQEIPSRVVSVNGNAIQLEFSTNFVGEVIIKK